MAGKSDAKSAFVSETFEKDGHFKIDRPVGSASISPCGRDIVLASRDGLDIIDLDNPYTAPRHLSHQTPWDVADVQWSPFASRDYWIVSTSNQKALVWNVGLPDTRASVEHILHGHKRAITDINFSAHYPDVLATCAVDSYIHCWDLRRPSKPALTFCDWFAGATQVKWNRQEAHVLASSHDKYLKIWDDRNGAQPLKTIAAHATKIYGVDWDRKDTRMLATCSLDQTIKCWNYANESDVPTMTFWTPFPVWRARYTPFGNGLVALPQRDDFDLHLYDRSIGSVDETTTLPVHRFRGHSNQVKEFLWRVRGDITASADTREFQLVSWGADQQLRLHRVHKDTLRKVDHENSKEERPINFTRKGAKYKTFQKEQKPLQDSIFGWDTSQPKAGVISGISSGLKPYPNGYGSEGFMSAIDRNRTAVKEVDPIAWMRGVKIRKQSSPPSGEAGATDDMFSAETKATSWETFDSLGEEVTVVLDKFPKVTVDKIDIKHRTLTLLLPGMSFKARPHTTLKCRLDFPKTYPEQASPSLSIDNGESGDFVLTTATLDEIKQLSAAYLSKGRPSLEAILHFLLGEATIGEIIQLLDKPQDLAASTLLADDSSSSDDEDLQNSAHGVLGDKEATSSKSPLVDNTLFNIPRPNTCGARFTVGGRLVYFVTPKREDHSLLGQSLGIGSQVSGTGRDMFEGFGRLHQSHRSKRMSPTLGTAASDESDTESFELSSSESSTSSTDPYQLKSALLPTAPWNGFDAGLPFGRDMTASQQSQVDLALTQQTSLSAPKSNARIIIMHPIAGQLLDERLARRYRYGSDHQSMIHNATTAEMLGYRDLGNVWNLCAIALTSDTSNFRAKGASPRLPLQQTLKSEQMMGDIPESWETGASQTSQDTSSLDIDRWVVDQCLQNIERIGDVQSSATLTCALAKPLLTASHVPTSDADWDFVEMETKASPNRSESKQAFSVQQSLNTKSWQDDLKSAFSKKFVPMASQAVSLISQRKLSLGGPPSDPRHIRANSISKLAQLSALSEPNDNERGLRRVNSTLNTLSVPFTHAFQQSQSAASSPPNHLVKKKLSPAGSLLSSGQTAGAWMPSQWLSKASFGSDDSRSTISPPKPRTLPQRESHSSDKQKASLVLKLTNQKHFTTPHTSILNGLDAHKHYQWRRSYAEILSAWGMHLESAEIRYLDTIDRAARVEPTLPSQSNNAATQGQHVIFRSHCSKCDHAQTSNKSIECEKCAVHLYPLICNCCQKYIIGLSSPCLYCGHILHTTCRSKLAERGVTECITGCGCRCAEHNVAEMSMPETQKAKSDFALDVPSTRPKIIRSVSSTQEDGAYHSLAKTLDKRRGSRGGGLKATSSHIWRGG